MIVKTGMEEQWNNEVKAANKDSYTKGIISYAIAYAGNMEKYILQGKKVAEIAKVADKETLMMPGMDITGFMHGCAIALLCQYWIYGSELKVWHNEQYGYKGNGVANDAILTVKI